MILHKGRNLQDTGKFIPKLVVCTYSREFRTGSATVFIALGGVEPLARRGRTPEELPGELVRQHANEGM